MKRLLTALGVILLACSSVVAQTQHDRLNGRGMSVFDALTNRTTILISGATPSVASGNVFKTNNVGPTTVTNFTGGVDSQRISVNCGDTNTTIQNNSNIVLASGSDFVCSSTNIGVELTYDLAQTKWVQSGGSATPPSGSAGDLQMKGTPGNRFAASHLNDSGALLSSSVPVSVTGDTTSTRFLNASITTITGATPSVSGNNVFKTNNGGSTTVTNFAGGAAGQQIQVICGDTNTTIQNNSTIQNASGADIICTLGMTQTYVFDSAATKWRQSGGGAAGCSPGGNTGDLQAKNAGACAAAGENDDGTNLKVQRDIIPYGPNPYVDIRKYNVRAVVSAPSTTGSINSGSATLTVPSGTGFQNNDGIVIRGAGATNTLSTPAAPTVTPSNASVLTGTGIDVASPTGATTYQYCVAAVTTSGAMTPCSANTSIANGQATLGANNVSVSSISASGTTITVTTSASHTLAVGANVVMSGTFGFDGWYQVTTVPDTTHFTVSTLNNTTNGSSTVGSTGTVYWWNSNRITWTAVSNAWKYAIYGRTAGGMAFIGWSFPQSSLTTISTYLEYDDYGATMSIPPTVPDWVPSTPPVAAKNADLVTTIASGGGTTTLTLAATASNTVAGATVKFDNAPNIFTAVQAMQGTGKGVLVFPAVPGSSYFTNSFLGLPGSGPSSILVLGTIFLGDTLQQGGNIYWSGKPLNPDTIPSFGFQNLPKIFSNAAWPMIYTTSGTLTNFEYLNLQNGSPNQALLFLDDTNGAIPRAQFDHVQFFTQGSNDYLSMHYVARGTAATAGFFFKQCQFFSGPNQVIGSTATPLLYFDGGSPSGVGGTVKLENTFSNRRGFLFSNSPTGVQIDDKWHYIQGGVMPLWTAINSGSFAGFGLRVENYTEDTTQQPVLWAVSGLQGLVEINGGVGPSPGTPIVSQGSTGQVAVRIKGVGNVTIGQNMGTDNGPYYTSAIDGIKTTSPAALGQKLSHADGLLGNRYQYAVIGLPMASPTVTGPTSGGSMPVGTNTFTIAPVGVTGGEIALQSSVSTSCVTTSGNQTCTLNWTAYPNAIGYDIYRNGFSMACSAPGVAGGLTTSAILSTTGCGQSAPQGVGSGLAGITSASVFGPSLVLSGNGFKTTFTSPLNTANRTITTPDNSGQIMLSTAGAVFGSNHILVTDTAGLMSDYGVAPGTVYDSFARANGTILAGNPNWTTVPGTSNINVSGNTITAGAAGYNIAVYNGVSFPTDDQTARVRVTNAGTGANAFGWVVARGSVSANTWYGCGANKNTNVFELRKLVSGSATTIISASYTPAVNDVWTINATGTTITCLINGVQPFAPQTDASISSGYPGVGFFGTNALSTSNFAASYGHVSLNVAQTWAAVQTAGASGGFDANASTSTSAGLRMPNIAGTSTTTAGAMVYDTTNKMPHVGANGVDNLVVLKPTSVSVANNDCANYQVASSVITHGTAGAPCSTPSSADTLTNKTVDAEGTGNTITIPFKLYINAALCNNATPGASLNLPTSNAPTPTCNTGTNVQEGTLDFADGQTAQFAYPLPTDWSGAIDARAVFFDSSTTGTVIFSLASACTAVNGSANDDTAFNTATNFGTVTLASPANALWTSSLTGLTTTGCSAGNRLMLKVKRETDTAAGVARLQGIELTVRRAM